MATAEESTEQSVADGLAELQAADDEVEEQGYAGYSPDETPRENYSLQTPQDAEVPELTARVSAAEEANARKIEARNS